MGKKRRLKSAATKFGGKHSSHPRARLLAAQRTLQEATIEATPEAIEPVIETIVEAVPPIIEEEEITVVPEVVAKPKRTRKRKTRTSKRPR